MQYLSKPIIDKCEFQKVFISNGFLTRLRLTVSGWGNIHIRSIKHSDWVGVKKSFFGEQRTIIFLVPKDSIIRVKCNNIFGSTIFNYKSSKPNPKLQVQLPDSPAELTFNQFPNLELISAPFMLIKPTILIDEKQGSSLGCIYKNDAELEDVLPRYKSGSIPEAKIKRNLLKAVFPENSIKL
jgi:hypothetical protein